MNYLHSQCDFTSSRRRAFISMWKYNKMDKRVKYVMQFGGLLGVAIISLVTGLTTNMELNVLRRLLLQTICNGTVVN